MRADLRQRLASEYQYAVKKMQESPDSAKKLFYFSVLFGEAQRVLNIEWDRDLALIYAITFHAHSQINAAGSLLGPVFPVDGTKVFEALTGTASELALYMGKTRHKNDGEELNNILGRFSEIAYVVSGNGSYLFEKGIIKL